MHRNVIGGQDNLIRVGICYDLSEAKYKQPVTTSPRTQSQYM